LYNKTNFLEEDVMSYKKPEVLAKNQPTGSYSAGCPEKTGTCWRSCEIRK